MKDTTKIGLLYTPYSEKALLAVKVLKENFNIIDLKTQPYDNQINFFLVLGGDGFMLSALHKYKQHQKPFFGINFGTLGFLLNDITPENLINLKKLVNEATEYIFFPLMAEITNIKGHTKKEIAFNEVSVNRATSQALHIDISINKIKRMKEFIGDGLVLSNPIGSTAYNTSLGGPITTSKANIMILSPNSPFKPKGFRSVILNNNVEVEFSITASGIRKANVSCDTIEFKDVKKVLIKTNFNLPIKLLFLKEKNIEEKVLIEQFKF